MSSTQARQPNARLRDGTLGPVLLAGLGVSYVIAGDYAGWNFGLAFGGWGGLAIAVAAAAAMFFALILSLAELAAVMPAAGGGYEFARRAFGPGLALATGLAILIEYAAAASVVAIFIDAYFGALIGVGGMYTISALFLGVTAIHAAGVGEAMRVLLALSGIATLGLVLYLLGIYQHFSPAHLRDLPVSIVGGSVWLPSGWRGIWAAFPFGTAFFLAVEGIPMAAEEARDPPRTVPRAMLTAMLVLFGFAIALVTLGPGAAGVAALTQTNDPLIVVLTRAGRSGWLLTAVNVCGVVGLGACFFAAMFAYSRQAFALARAGFLPALLARTNQRQSPAWALLCVGTLSYLLALTGVAAAVYVVMVTGASLSYLVMLAAHWRLRVIEPDLPRPYRTPGGRLTSCFALIMSGLCLIACFMANPLWAGATTAAIILGAGLLSRRAGRSAAGRSMDRTL
jgi:ethanolamine permease